MRSLNVADACRSSLPPSWADRGAPRQSDRGRSRGELWPI